MDNNIDLKCKIRMNISNIFNFSFFTKILHISTIFKEKTNSFVVLLPTNDTSIYSGYQAVYFDRFNFKFRFSM